MSMIPGYTLKFYFKKLMILFLRTQFKEIIQPNGVS